MKTLNLLNNEVHDFNFTTSKRNSLHSKYINIFIPLIILFLILGYYLNHICRKYMKRVRPIAEKTALYRKYELCKNLAITNFSKIRVNDSKSIIISIHNN